MDQTIVRIAEQLGFQAARIWPQIVMVTWVTSLFWTVVDPLVIAGCALGAFQCLRFMRRVLDVAEDDTDVMLPLMGGGVAILALFILAVAALTGWPDNIAGAVYPEATTVLRIAKGLK